MINIAKGFIFLGGRKMGKNIFSAKALDSRITSANVQKSEMWLGYFFGPCFVYMAYYAIAGTYLTQFYTDVLGIGGLFLTMMPFASKVFDAITNVIMGRIIDKIRTRQGKARPWILISGVLMAVTGALLYMVPKASYTVQIVWIVVSYNLFFALAFTIYNMSHALMVPLALGLLDGDDKKQAEGQLVKAVKEYRYCVGTGFLSTPFLLPVLTEAGHSDVAYRMLENTKKPGWLGEVLDGATTVWENWEGDLSQNHYSPGAVCQWLFEAVAGIHVDGENHFTIVPVPGGTLTYAEASYASLYGTVCSKWEKTEAGLRFTIVLPANTFADIILPDGGHHKAGCGKHTYEMKAVGMESVVSAPSGDRTD